MDFTRPERRRKPRLKPDLSLDIELLYPKNGIIYRVPPTEKISIQEFEEFSFKRLQVLRIFEKASLSHLKVQTNEWREYVQTELKRNKLDAFCKPNCDDVQSRRWDYVSHFILRLVYCRHLELIRWFILREIEFFYFKYESIPLLELQTILEDIKIPCTKLSKEDKYNFEDETLEEGDYFRVRFTDGLSLVQTRQCFLSNGYAYINSLQLLHILAEKQQSEIVYGLHATAKIMVNITSDDRIKNLVQNVAGQNESLIVNKGSVRIGALDKLSSKSYPLCMRSMHEHLREHHHLKYDGRNQYGLFLKGIGVSLESSLQFWREEFTKIMDIEKYSKGYAYKIRHNYGLEGSRIDYSPYSCTTILKFHVGPSEKHGCPFLHYDHDELKKYLKSCDLALAEVEEIANLARGQKYPNACGLYFKALHGIKAAKPITHPNQYFEMSQDILRKSLKNPTLEESLLIDSDYDMD